jgi:hypothetical protein
MDTAFRLRPDLDESIIRMNDATEPAITSAQRFHATGQPIPALLSYMINK